MTPVEYEILCTAARRRLTSVKPGPAKPIYLLPEDRHSDADGWFPAESAEPASNSAKYQIPPCHSLDTETYLPEAI